MNGGSRFYPVAKRAFDITLCLVTLPITVVIMVLVAIAIRVDSPGPILFVQQRTGRNGVRFPMLKFRTMVQNAEELKASLQHLSIVPPPDFKVLDDPRITRIGNFLRRSSLDELPQVFNILAGQMSLVGPRPTSFSPETYSLWHTRRLEVRPGLTGLWQISGRNESDFDERLRLDVRYIDHLCLQLDVRILLATAFSVLRREGA